MSKKLTVSGGLRPVVDVKLPAPTRAIYSTHLPERSEIVLSPSPGEELCVRRNPTGSLLVFSRKKTR